MFFFLSKHFLSYSCTGTVSTSTVLTFTTGLYYVLPCRVLYNIQYMFMYRQYTPPDHTKNYGDPRGKLCVRTNRKATATGYSYCTGTGTASTHRQTLHSFSCPNVVSCYPKAATTARLIPHAPLPLHIRK